MSDRQWISYISSLDDHDYIEWQGQINCVLLRGMQAIIRHQARLEKGLKMAGVTITEITEDG